MIVLKAEGEDAIETRERGRALAELEQHFTETGERVFVIGIEPARFIKRTARPRELLAREPRVAHPDMQLDGVGIEAQPLPEYVDGFVVLSFVVELMRTFVVFVGAEERIRHRTGPPWKVVL